MYTRSGKQIVKKANKIAGSGYVRSETA